MAQTLTVDEWRESTEMRLAAQELLNNATLLAMLDACAASHPKENQMLIYKDGIQVAIKLGQIEGYDLFRNNLLSLSQPIAIHHQQEIPTTWAEPKQPE